MKITEAEIISMIKECVLNIIKESKGLDPSKRYDNFAQDTYGNGPSPENYIPGDPDSTEYKDKLNKPRIAAHKARRGAKKIKGLKEGMALDNPSPNKFGYLVNRYGAKKVLNQILEWTDNSQIEEYIQWFEQEGWFENEDYD